jgi:predicted secreted protein
VYSAQWRREDVTIPILDIFETDTTANLMPVNLKIGKPIFIGLHKHGGTGYFWDATVIDDTVVTVKYIRSRSEKPDETNIVGSPEADIFDVQPKTAGSTAVNFELRRVRSSAIRTITVQVRVEG